MARRDWLTADPERGRQVAAALLAATRNAADHLERAGQAAMKAGLIQRPIPVAYLPEYPRAPVTAERFAASLALNLRFHGLARAPPLDRLLWPAPKSR